MLEGRGGWRRGRTRSKYDRVVQQAEQSKQLFDTSTLEVGGPRAANPFRVILHVVL